MINKLRELTEGVWVMIPCEVVSVENATSLLTVRPIIYIEEQLPNIVKVPIFQLGNKSIKIKVNVSIGDIIPVFFTKMDINDYINTGATGMVTNEDNFNLTNAIALPFLFHTALDGQSVSNSIDILGDVNGVGNWVQNGNIDITGDVTINGNLTVAGAIIGDTVEDKINDLTNHYHTTQTPAKPL